MGLLDHIVDVEENFEGLSKIVNLVATKLTEELTPEMTKATVALTSTTNLTSKQKRNVIKGLANHVNTFANFLKPNNDEYRILNSKLETSIEIVLTNSEEDQDSVESIENFITGFELLETGAMDGREGFISFLATTKNLPNLEKSFNRANKYMQQEIENLIDNIDQTISMSSRAQLLGNSLLAKLVN